MARGFLGVIQITHTSGYYNRQHTICFLRETYSNPFPGSRQDPALRRLYPQRSICGGVPFNALLPTHAWTE